MKIHVLKFGGSSICEFQRILSLSKIVKQYQNDLIYPVLVLSAIGRTTSQLIQCAKVASSGQDINLNSLRDFHFNLMKLLELDESTFHTVQSLFDSCDNILKGVALIKELSPATLDVIMSFGERISVQIVARYLQKMKIHAQPFDAPDLGLIVKGTSSYGSSTKQITGTEILEKSYELIALSLRKALESNIVPVITGFIAKNELNRIVTLGRGGSDLSASIIGTALSADMVEIWTDTPGVLTGDPKIISNAKTISYLTFAQASELAYFGAKVLHPKTIQPAMEANIPVSVRSSYDPSHLGTIISNSCVKDTSQLVIGLTLKTPVILIDIKATQMMGQYGFMAEIFKIFEQHRISVDVIATSEISVSLTLDKDTELELVEKVKQQLKNIADVTIIGERSIITLIGDTKRPTDVMAIVCQALKLCAVQVEMISLSASKLNTSLVVPTNSSTKVLIILHNLLFS